MRQLTTNLADLPLKVTNTGFASILLHDRADQDKKVTCPVLALWGAKAPMGRLYDVLGIWRERATTP